MVEFETELSPGLFAGQKLIPMTAAGCYVPGGTIRAYRVGNHECRYGQGSGRRKCGRLFCSPWQRRYPSSYRLRNGSGGRRYHPGDGGVQGVAAMAFGLFTGKPADILVGPGNRFVAEAKRLLFGRVGNRCVRGSRLKLRLLPMKPQILKLLPATWQDKQNTARILPPGCLPSLANWRTKLSKLCRSTSIHCPPGSTRGRCRRLARLR